MSNTWWDSRPSRIAKGMILLTFLGLVAADSEAYGTAICGFGVGFLCGLYIV